MRKCHYTYDKEVGKVLIPGCMSVANSNDIDDWVFMYEDPNIKDHEHSYRRPKDINKAKTIKKQADKMKFQFDKKEVSINYGSCNSFKKQVSFIPNICQIETQECFIHRKLFKSQ